MTYLSDTELSNLNAETEPSTFDKLKTLTKEGTARSQRISKILRKAFSETRSEFQEGRTVISPLAKEVTTEAVSSFKTKSQQAAEAVNQAWQDDADAPDLADKLVSFIKAMAKVANERLFPEVKKQAVKLDDVLGDRYGDQYVTLKNRFETVRDWVVVSEPTGLEVDEPISDATIEIEVDSEVVQ